MAGIGFELRKLLKKESYLGLLQAYAYAGIISSGPWILSIIGVQLIGLLSLNVVVPDYLITQFQVSVTYIIAGSLILTGILQPAFTRYIADRLFDKRDDMVLPNFIGIQIVIVIMAAVVSTPICLFMFPKQSPLYALLMLCAFAILAQTWIATIFLSGMKQYKEIVFLFFVGYAIVVACVLLMRGMGLEGLLLGFVIGHYVLLMGMYTLTIRNFPAKRFVDFDFLKKGRMYPSLMATGFIYNFGIWADKLMFWYYPDTSQAIIGPLRASVIYDFPIFLAYLSIIPGMAVFLVRIETDFVEYYQKFYDAVREGGSLEYIEDMRNEMVYTIRQGVYEIIKIQGIAVLILFVAGEPILRWLGVSQLYLPLLYIDVVAAGLQVAFLGLINVFFYLDRRGDILVLVSVFCVLNCALTWATLKLGAPYYGYGFAVALLITMLFAMSILDRRLDTLEYETFMLQ